MDNRLLEDIKHYVQIHPSPNINLNLLRKENKSLWSRFISNPTTVIPLFYNAIRTFGLSNSNFNSILNLSGHLGPNDLSPRQISSSHLNKLVSISGIVTSVSITKPKLEQSVHYSKSLDSFYSKSYISNLISHQPNNSENLNSNSNLQIDDQPFRIVDPMIGIISNLQNQDYNYVPKEYLGTPLSFETGLSTYYDTQKVVIQELVELTPPGQIPRTVECIFVGTHLCSKSKPGDRVKLYGVYKSVVSYNLFGSNTSTFPNKFGGLLVVFNMESLIKDKYLNENDGLEEGTLSLDFSDCCISLKVSSFLDNKFNEIFQRNLDEFKNNGSLKELNQNLSNEIVYEINQGNVKMVDMKDETDLDLNSNNGLNFKNDVNGNIIKANQTNPSFPVGISFTAKHITNILDNGLFRSKEDINLLYFYKSIKDNPLSKLSKFIAPSIFGHSIIKKSIVLLLLSGNTPDRNSNFNSNSNSVSNTDTPLRSTINILLIGDPSTAKSQLLRYTSTLFNFISSSGRGSSGVGLTALVLRDNETGEKYVQAGAMVLADYSVICIDEFDKIKKDDRASLHEAMEQQSVSVCKAGLNVTLNARCSVLAAANPKHCNMSNSSSKNINKFKRNRTGIHKIKNLRLNDSNESDYSDEEIESKYLGDIRSLIDLEESLLTRFDLVFCIEDKIDEEYDRKIAEKVMENHSDHRECILQNIGNIKNIHTEKKHNEEEDNEFTVINEKNISLFKSYILKAKSLKPLLTKKARDLIIKTYTEMRQKRKKSMLNIKVTPRTLETIIRMAIAHCKLRMCEFVGEKDVEIGVEILYSSMEKRKRDEDRKKEVKEENIQNMSEERMDQENDVNNNEEDDLGTVTDVLFALKENNDERFFLFDDFMKMVSMDKKRVESVLWRLNENDVIIFDGKMITFI